MKYPVYRCEECGDSWYIEIEDDQQDPEYQYCTCGGFMEWVGHKDEI